MAPTGDYYHSYLAILAFFHADSAFLALTVSIPFSVSDTGNETLILDVGGWVIESRCLWRRVQLGQMRQQGIHCIPSVGIDESHLWRRVQHWSLAHVRDL